MADAALAFSRSIVQSFLQAKQFELQERREQRYSDQLQENRLFRHQQASAVERRFARTEKRLTASTKSLIAQRGRPLTGTKAHFASLGYDPEEQQRLQDQAVGLISKPSSAYQRATAGKMMMENATTIPMFESGRQIMEDAMRELQGQNPAFPSGQGGEADETINFETTDPIGSGVFQPRTPDTGAAILGGRVTQDFLPPEPDAGIFDRINQLDSRVEVRHTATGDVFTVPREELEDLLAEGEYELVEK